MVFLIKSKIDWQLPIMYIPQKQTTMASNTNNNRPHSQAELSAMSWEQLNNLHMYDLEDWYNTKDGKEVIDHAITNIIEQKIEKDKEYKKFLETHSVKLLFIKRLEELAGKSPTIMVGGKDMRPEYEQTKKNILESEITCKKFNDAANYKTIITIKAWEQIRNNSKDKNILDKINEATYEFLQAGWEHCGQANIVSQGNMAKEEYNMFKFLLSRTKNKPCRRGGKKHKKK